MNSTGVQRDSLQSEAYSLKPALTDRLGTVRARGIGTSLARTTYYPFGEEIGTVSANDQYRFASTYRDSSSGLDYAVNRYYASGMGRFLAVDQGPHRTGRPQSWNKYSYGLNDPVNLFDPAGLDAGAPCGTDAAGLGLCDIDTAGDAEMGRVFYDSMIVATSDTETPPEWDPTPTPISPTPTSNPPANKKKKGPPAPCNSPILQNQYLTIYAQMGKDLGIDPMFIMAVSLQESGWNLTHVYETNSSSNGQPLNNLFGSTYGGANNVAYPSVQASATAWEQNWGPYLANKPQTIGAFTADLTSNPEHMYNASANWPGRISRVYGTLQREFQDCGITFPKP